MKLPAFFSKPIFCFLFILSFCSADAQDTARYYIEKGSGYYNTGNYDSAIYNFTIAISIDSSKAESYISRGLAYYSKTSFDSAILDFSSAAELNPNYSFAYANRGNAYLKMNKPDLAVFDFNKTIALDSNFTQAYANRGFAYAQNKQFFLAIRDYSKAIHLDTNYSFAYANRGYAYSQLKIPKPDSALLDLTKAISLDSAITHVYGFRGFAYLLKNKYDSAILDFTTAIRMDSGYSFAYSKRGYAYSKLKQFDLAIGDFTKNISLEPGNSNAYESRSLAWFEIKQVESAMEDIKYAIKLSPVYVGYYHTRGIFYNLTAKYDSSVLDFKKCIELDSLYGKAYINIISPLVRLNLFDTATSYFYLYSKKKLGSFLDNPKYKVYRTFVTAVTNVSRGNMKLALETIEAVNLQYNAGIKDEIKRAYLDILFVKAYILNKKELYNEAKVLYEKSLILDPQQPNLVKTLQVIESQIEKKRAIMRGGDKTVPKIDSINYSYVKKQDRGFTIEADSTKIQITGTAKDDESGIDSVIINGVKAVVEKDGYFIATINITKGYNSLKITATDGKGNTAVRSVDIGAPPKEKKKDEEDKMEKRKYYAILIAEKDYMDDNLEDLERPISDANQLRDVLVNQYTFDPENVDTLYNKSREAILELVIKKNESLTDNDNLFIFFAGHGEVTINKLDKADGYLIPSDAIKGKRHQYIGSQDIQQILSYGGAKHILIVLDACFSGALLMREMSQTVPENIKEQNKNASRKMMTSGNVEKVPDISIFIKYFIKSLVENENEYLSTNDIWKKVKPEVEKQANKEPRYIAVDDVGDRRGQFIFERRKKN